MSISESRFPAEWEPHQGTIIAWPNFGEVFSEKHLLIAWLFAEVVRVLSLSEHVHVFAHDAQLGEILRDLFHSCAIPEDRYSIAIVSQSYCWMRDAGPTAVVSQDGETVWIQWGREGTSKTGDLIGDSSQVPLAVAELTGCRLVAAESEGKPFLMEGGVFDGDGEGTLIVTEECLLSRTPPELVPQAKARYAELFGQYLGARKVVWVKKGLSGDQTFGHVDNVARFVAPGKVVIAWEEKTGDPNYEVTRENRLALESELDAAGRTLEVVPVPLPDPVYCHGVRLPASYLNFYISNDAILVPTFNDSNDVTALQIFQSLFPEKKVIGFASRQLIVAGGSLHCLTQPIPYSGGGCASMKRVTQPLQCKSLSRAE